MYADTEPDMDPHPEPASEDDDESSNTNFEFPGKFGQDENEVTLARAKASKGMAPYAISSLPMCQSIVPVWASGPMTGNPRASSSLTAQSMAQVHHHHYWPLCLSN